jgi:hypothetical protein
LLVRFCILRTSNVMFLSCSLRVSIRLFVHYEGVTLGTSLIKASHAEEGAKGLLKEGGTKGREAIAKMPATHGDLPPHVVPGRQGQ